MISRWKEILLSAYYHGTLPYRRFANGRAARHGRAPVMLLFYHRIADQHPNDWTMTNSQFAAQIEWLKTHFDLISLEEAQHRVRSGRNSRAAVSITFDDGYADNLAGALPLLVKNRIPCTYFVSSNHVLNNVPFPHDVTRGVRLPPNTVDQLKALSDSGIEIGAHTRTHANLGVIEDKKQLWDEVVTCRDELERAVGCMVRYFAFPFGLHENLNANAFGIAREAGYEAVVSAYGGYNFPGDDPFHLQRIHADPEMIRLRNWLTVDPRKRTVPRFVYDLDPVNAHETLASTP